RRAPHHERTQECSAQILSYVYRPVPPSKLPSRYPQNTCTPYDLAISSHNRSSRTAPSVLPRSQSRGAHSPQAATRACSPCTLFAVLAIRSPVTLENWAASGRSLTINVAIVSASSNAIYRPCSIAALISKPSACNLVRSVCRCSSVATTIAAFPVLRTAPTKRV